MDVKVFIQEMERLAPPDLAEDFDEGKIGLIVEGAPEFDVVCCALDATPAVVNEAIRLNAGMLVVHHTPLWAPLTALTGPVATLMRDVLSAQMNVWVMHTNFDHAPEGVNNALAELLSLSDTVPLTLGLVGTCTITPAEISRRLGCPLRIWGEAGTIRRLAVIAGSGFDPAFLHEAQEKGAEAVLSAELKHSVMRSSPLPCIEATHYALEAPAMRRLASRRGWQYIEDEPRLKTVP
ncbi:Nif3-like dinuclear metal center hexameric protein [Methanoregula sp.]|uniref:Nif3-like dinuclear metal center hexameric protein n=1 Tax=Methanoregula sp. TaxID=2052170 RepID=UPI000CC6400E|nr:Nif3-like dinuclear metal center hexameric protein [Methanoregula sp.]PKG33435.1 MAG: NGG1p interacting factor NIF3 [Methanoregula sp.]